MFKRLLSLLRHWFPHFSPKTERRKRGDAGEAFARRFLRQSGYKILLCNWTHGSDEIDIVALERNCLVFIEVKTRAEQDKRGGYAAVDKRKRNAQKRAISAYLNALRKPPTEHRFDVVEVFVAADGKMRAVHHRAVPLTKSR